MDERKRGPRLGPEEIGGIIVMGAMLTIVLMTGIMLNGERSSSTDAPTPSVQLTPTVGPTLPPTFLPTPDPATPTTSPTPAPETLQPSSPTPLSAPTDTPVPSLAMPTPRSATSAPSQSMTPIPLPGDR
jgi:hypothetical protein